MSGQWVKWETPKYSLKSLIADIERDVIYGLLSDSYKYVDYAELVNRQLDHFMIQYRADAINN